jgi:NTE family protein
VARDSVAHFLPATVFTGIGVGLSFAAWSSAAVAELPPERFATGSAVSVCLRQIGAVLGIAALIAILEHVSPVDPLAAFDHAFRLEAATGLLAAGLALGLGRVRVRASIPAPATETA